MTLEETWESEALRQTAKRQALDAEKCATDLAIQLRTTEMRLATLQNRVEAARLYLAMGQYWAAQQILESL